MLVVACLVSCAFYIFQQQLLEAGAVQHRAGAVPGGHGGLRDERVPEAHAEGQGQLAHLGWHYLSNAASCVLYGATCLTRLVVIEGELDK